MLTILFIAVVKDYNYGSCFSVHVFNMFNIIVTSQLRLMLISMHIFFCHKQVMQAEDDDDIKLCFSIDEGESLLYATGFRKAMCSLTLLDRPAIVAALLDFHLLVKVKAEMDQFKEG